MVDNNIEDIAIIFNHKKLENGDEIYIPFKVVEGYYDDVEEWFIDKSGNAYHHMNEPISSGNVYACRQKIGKVVNTYRHKTFQEIKKELLSFAKKFIYKREYTDLYHIIMIDKKTNEEFNFKDIDTDRIYETCGFDVEEQEDNTLEPIEITENSASKEEKELSLTPKELASKIKETIKGQDEAIDKIVTALYLNRNYPELKKKNMLLIGPSGVGKTAIFQALSKILDVPVVIFSTAGLSQAGYVGRGTEEILSQIIMECNKDVSLANKAIVVLDEIDKLAYQGYESGSVSTKGVQNEILKIIEGDKRDIKIGGIGSYTIDTTNITFIGLGAFSELYEKRVFNKKPSIGFSTGASTEIDSEEKIKINSDELVNYGLKRELVGRLPVIVELNNLTEENLKDIIINSKDSELVKILKIFETAGITCSNVEEVIDIIVKDAISRKIGARGIISTITEIFMSIFYDALSNDSSYDELIVGKNILNDKSDYQLIKNKKLTKRLSSSMENQ